MIGQSPSHFRLTGQVGAGGMGEVYRAEDSALGREVAIKVLPAAFTADAERLAGTRVTSLATDGPVARIIRVGRR